MKILHFLFSALACAALATHGSNDVAMKSRGSCENKWGKRDGIDADAHIAIRIALKQQNLEKGMEMLLNVSDPSSPNYGRYYTQDQVLHLFAPKDESIRAVREWLIKAGVSNKSISASKSKGWLDVCTTVQRLEHLFRAKFEIYSCTNGRGSFVLADTYTIPGTISAHVDFIAPFKVFGSSRSKNRRAPAHLCSAKGSTIFNQAEPKSVDAQMVTKLQENLNSTQYCTQYVTPKCIRELYGIPHGTLSSPHNRLGIFEYNDEMYSQQDLTMFYGLFAPEIPSTAGPLVHFIDYGTAEPNPANAFGEAALDFDMAQPLLYPQSTVLFQTKTNFNVSNNNNGLFNQFLDAIDGVYCETKSLNGSSDDWPTVDGVTPNEMCGSFKPTNVVSFSYSWPESVYPAGYLERQCNEFMKLGLQGTTIVFSSGDGGVAGVHGFDCLGSDKDIFNPLVGAACPYVTSVGATEFPSGDVEVAAKSFASGGGFSNTWTTPSYQQSAVDSYFKHYDPGFPSYTTSRNSIPSSGNGVYNRVGRGYPDVAAVGDNGVTVFQNEVKINRGTSMAAPIFASIINRLNEERIAKGKPLIGFANPALYSNPGMFHDVTIGNQSTGGYCLGKGFSAVPGWDPVTGLGTPNYLAMREYFLQLH